MLFKSAQVQDSRYDRTRRSQAIYVTAIVALISACVVAGMIYLYYDFALSRH